MRASIQKIPKQPPVASLDDDKPLVATVALPNGVNGHSQPTNGVNGLSDNMSEDEAPLNSRGTKRKKIQDSSSDSDQPLASSSPVKNLSTSVPMPGAANGFAETKKAANLRAAASKKSYKEEESSEDDVPLSQATPTTTPVKPRKKPVRKKARQASETPEQESEDEKPLIKEKPKPARKKRAKQESDEDEDEDDVPVKNARKKPKASTRKAKMETSENDGEISTPKPKAKSSKATNGTKKSKAEANGSPKKASKEEEEEDTYKWWEQQQQDEQDAADALGDGSVKWKTLQHNGVLFPPPYQPLPDHVKLHYNGKPVSLPPAAEEVAGFFAAMLATDHARDSVFQENFFKDFLRVLKDAPPKDGTVIETFESCDFRKMYDHFESEKAKKQGMTSAQKKELKEAQNQVEEKYKTCLLDGRKEKVGNFRVEPPGLFRGRGDHPKKGALKNRLRPEDIVINIGENEEIPVPNVPGTWKKVVHDNTVTWLANWKENINGNFKYVFLAASSSLKGQSDMNKFEKARELKKHVDRIRKDYSQDLRAKVMADRQRATAMYFIDKLALRAGNEKGEDEADTVGCCSLRCEHVTADPPDKLIFDFLGKDSIRYYNNVPVDPQVFKNVRIFKEGKDHDDSLFDRVTTGALNKHLASYMPGLTAKVFRTYNASITLQQQLDDHTPADGTVMEKLAAYNKANRMVAILCNHQRSVAKGHGDSMQKMADKLKGLKYDRMKLRHALFALDAKYRKKKAFSELESDLDEEWIESWEDRLRDKDIEKAEKKFIKDNEKLTAEGKETLEESVLKDRIKDIRQEHARLVKERGTDKAELKRSKPAEKIEEAIESLDQKIKNFKLQMEDKEEGKEVSLGTSKINYLDPRITSAWCAKHDVPITKIFSKALVQKFPWAMSSDPDWKF